GRRACGRRGRRRREVAGREVNPVFVERLRPPLVLQAAAFLLDSCIPLQLARPVSDRASGMARLGPAYLCCVLSVPLWFYSLRIAEPIPNDENPLRHPALLRRRRRRAVWFALSRSAAARAGALGLPGDAAPCLRA